VCIKRGRLPEKPTDHQAGYLKNKKIEKEYKSIKKESQSNLGRAESPPSARQRITTPQSPHWLQWDAPHLPQNCSSPSTISTPSNTLSTNEVTRRRPRLLLRRVTVHCTVYVVFMLTIAIQLCFLPSAKRKIMGYRRKGSGNALCAQINHRFGIALDMRHTGCAENVGVNVTNVTVHQYYTVSDG